jgi:hypothetical protein
MSLARGAVMREFNRRHYAHPEALATIEWVEESLDHPSNRLVESSEDTF